MKNKCSSCDGTGENSFFIKGKTSNKKCCLCDGSGFRTNSTKQIICPYCGENNSPDDFHESGEDECGGCDKRFFVNVDYTINYSTSRVDCLNDESLHEWKHEDWYHGGMAKDGKYYYRCSLCSGHKWLEKVLDLKPSEGE